MGRKIVFGDIHGALKALQQLVGQIQPVKNDELVFLGDYVDGWSESAQLLDYLMTLRDTCSCAFIRGNHDAWAQAWLKTGIAEPAEWVRNGGAQTMASYNGYSVAQRQKHLEFLESMNYYFIDQENRLFVHAGFSATQGPAKEHFESNFFWDRTLWELALAMSGSTARDDIYYPKRLRLFNEIFIGHTPTTNYGISTPMNAQNVWNIDTGAAFRGPVSAMDINTKQYWQSDPAWTLYPGENGRNKI